MVNVEPSWVFKEKGLRCRNASVDGCVQIVVSVRQQAALLYKTDYPKMAEHPETKRIYDTLRQHYYRPCVPQDVHAFVLRCETYIGHRLSIENQQFLKVFSPSRPLEFIPN